MSLASKPSVFHIISRATSDAVVVAQAMQHIVISRLRSQWRSGAVEYRNVEFGNVERTSGLRRRVFFADGRF